MPEAVRVSLDVAQRERTSRAITQALEHLCAHAPVICVIDEFGKNLEQAANDPVAGDLFVLQEMAERATGRRALPLFVMTLQHLAFEDYVQGASGAQRTEWGKVQGRFEDVPFVETTEESVRLVATAFDVDSGRSAFEKLRTRWAREQYSTCERLGLGALIPGGEAAVAACYPLHPTALLTLPEMCARFGQHGRTLFSFLTGQEPFSVARFLAETPFDGSHLSTVVLPRLYDFFIESGVNASSRHAARLLEIDQIIRETSGLAADELLVLKTIGVLNLVTQGGPLRASFPMLRYALADAGLTERQLRAVVRRLEARSLLTFRDFADEYRIWEGSDVDVAALVGATRDDLEGVPIAELIGDTLTLPPAIAGRHSQRTGMLRYFVTRFVDATSPAVIPDDDADGLLVYFVGDPSQADDLDISIGQRPVVIATTSSYRAVADAVLDAAATRIVAQRGDVIGDRVARREAQERVALAQRRLDSVISTELRPGAEGVRFRVLPDNEPLAPTRGLSRLLSDVCDRVYSASPLIRNEMVARRELTSQGAKARRELMTAMVERGGEEWLGFTGFGPEKAMYAALLRSTCIHRAASDGSFGFGAPRGDELMSGVWGRITMLVERALEEPVALDHVWRDLMAPPVGLKEGPIPILITAFLLSRAEDVALYQEGTYQATLTAELLERLVKSPERFAVKHVRSAGTRNAVLDALRQALPPSIAVQGWRNQTVLGVAGPLLAVVRDLPPYVLRTSSLSAGTGRVRAALLNAREPDQLLFADLPVACGTKPFGARGRGRSEDVASYVSAIASALDELTSAYLALLVRCASDLADALTLPSELGEMRASVRSRAETLGSSLLEPRLRAFVNAIRDTELTDEVWFEALLNVVAGKPPRTWRDDDVARFPNDARIIAGAFNRVLALHFDVIAADGTGFDAHRVTVTNPDGEERTTVVWIDDDLRDALENVAETALREVQRVAGERGAEALLAMLAGKVLSGERTDLLGEGAEPKRGRVVADG
jgi:hypothetical protein